ncbi:hypothetical protein VCHC68A1_02373B, partial [Vibrio cholerae HC-68A1]
VRATAAATFCQFKQ